jgi:hypothetical protein
VAPRKRVISPVLGFDPRSVSKNGLIIERVDRIRWRRQSLHVLSECLAKGAIWRIGRGNLMASKPRKTAQFSSLSIAKFKMVAMPCLHP